ncbi:MAG TPA: DUF4080 domain-containing protein [Bacillota bacterium]|nr:DUF4080 domain-containing protein [Bacillota bacterium]
MRVLLTTLNSQFVHTALGIRYLREVLKRHPAFDQWEIRCEEYTINDHWSQIAAAIQEIHPDIVGFSCYIWNIKETILIARRLKQFNPNCYLLFGGPEATYRAEELIRSYAWLDGVLAGEAEETLPLLLQQLAKKETVNVAGFVARSCGNHDAAAMMIPQLSDLRQMPFPYTEEEMLSQKGRIFYYESSRGCPYTCQYCLSSVEKGVRWLPLERVFDDLRRFMAAGVQQVKFVDRTFNANRARAREIWQFLINEASTLPINFHFELAADLLGEEDVGLLRQAPQGLFQFEIGIQSTNCKTLSFVQRPMDFAQITAFVKAMEQIAAIHIHLDLIAGLPGEDWQSFAKSFNDVYALGTEYLQLGFLKLLPGTGLFRDAGKYGIIFDCEAPYEVLSTNWMNCDELLRLHRIEELLQRYGNSGRYHYTLDRLLQQFASPFTFYAAMEKFWQQQNWFGRPLRESVYWQRLWQFISLEIQDTIEITQLLCLLKFDFCLAFKDDDFPLPEMKQSMTEVQRELLYRYLESPDFYTKFPEYADMSAKEVRRKVRVEPFSLSLQRLLQAERLYPLCVEPMILIFVWQPLLRGGRSSNWIELRV